MAVHVQCNGCGAWGITDDHGFPDAAAVCTSPENEPEGSPEGSCCAEHESLEHHLEQARETGVSHCRPLTVTILGNSHPAGPGQGVLLQGGAG